LCLTVSDEHHLGTPSLHGAHRARRREENPVLSGSEFQRLDSPRRPACGFARGTIRDAEPVTGSPTSGQGSPLSVHPFSV